MEYVYTRPPLYPKQEIAFFNDSRYSIVEASTKAGKAQPLDSVVQTPSGPRRIGDLAIGDRVLNPEGGEATVVGVYPQGVKPVFRVVFNDGCSTRCCIEHLWMVNGKVTSLLDIITHRMFHPTYEYKIPPGVVLYPDGQSKWINARTMKSVYADGEEECVCIELDSDNHLYFTDNYIVTHNTVGCIVWLFEQAYKNGGKNKNFWWVAPVSDQTDIAFRRMKEAIPESLWSANESRKIIRLANGAAIWFKSGDNPDSLFGEDVYAAVIDEATRVKDESWHAVRSTLTATEGPIRIIGNVKGRRNWVFRLARMAEADDDPSMHYSKITAIDAAEAGVITWEEIESAKKLLPEHVFRELYLAEPGDDQGNPFGIEEIRARIFRGGDGRTTTRMPQTPVAAWGWDLARSQDWTVGIGLDKEGRVVKFLRWRSNWEETIQRVINSTGSTTALVDITGVGDPVGEVLRSEGGTNFKGFKFSTHSKQDLMVGLSIAIQQGNIGYPDGIIVNELESFEYDVRRDKVLYSAPSGQHDDCVVALALAVKALGGMDFYSGDLGLISVDRESPWRV